MSLMPCSRCEVNQTNGLNQAAAALPINQGSAVIVGGLLVLGIAAILLSKR